MRCAAWARARQLSPLLSSRSHSPSSETNCRYRKGGGSSLAWMRRPITGRKLWCGIVAGDHPLCFAFMGKSPTWRVGAFAASLGGSGRTWACSQTPSFVNDSCAFCDANCKNFCIATTWANKTASPHPGGLLLLAFSISFSAPAFAIQLQSQ